MAEEPTINVAGVEFSASQVLSVRVRIDGREIEIKEREEQKPEIGFK